MAGHIRRDIFFLVYALNIVMAAILVKLIEPNTLLIPESEPISEIGISQCQTNHDTYSPGDSRLYSLSTLSSILYRDIQLEVVGLEGTCSASMFLVNSYIHMPYVLNDQSSVTVKDTDSFDGNQIKCWKFFLYQNSVINGSICSEDSQDSVTLFIIKGWFKQVDESYFCRKKFAKFDYEKQGLEAPNIVYHTQVPDCQHKKKIEYKVPEGRPNNYFIIVVNCKDTTSPEVSFTMKVERWMYSIDTTSLTTPVANCTVASFAYRQCSLDIPFPSSLSEEYKILINILMPTSIQPQWDDVVVIRLMQSRRLVVWFILSALYMLISYVIIEKLFTYA